MCTEEDGAQIIGHIKSAYVHTQQRTEAALTLLFAMGFSAHETISLLHGLSFLLFLL